jgi:hypothetical protein
VPVEPESPNSRETDSRFPDSPGIEDIVEVVRKVLEERSHTTSNLEEITTELIKPRLLRIMTEPETKGLGLLIGELQSESGAKNWTIQGEGVICTEFEGVTIIVDVNSTVRKKILRDDPHLQLYVSTHWYPEWRGDAQWVCLVGKGATATDFVFATVMLRNCNAIGQNFAETNLPYTIRKVKERKDLMIALDKERAVNERETGIRETDDERRERERQERRRKREMERLRKLRLEMKIVLERERAVNESETGIRETHKERLERETQERWDRKVAGYNYKVSSGLEELVARISMSSELSSDRELQRRIDEIRNCISKDQWWAAYSSFGIARKRISLIEETVME